MPAGQTGLLLNGGWTYTIVPVGAQVSLLQQAYAVLKESVYGALVVQTPTCTVRTWQPRVERRHTPCGRRIRSQLRWRA